MVIKDLEAVGKSWPFPCLPPKDTLDLVIIASGLPWSSPQSQEPGQEEGGHFQPSLNYGVSSSSALSEACLLESRGLLPSFPVGLAF